jgi:hypothetical protein
MQWSYGMRSAGDYTVQMSRVFQGQRRAQVSEGFGRCPYRCTALDVLSRLCSQPARKGLAYGGSVVQLMQAWIRILLLRTNYKAGLGIT